MSFGLAVYNVLGVQVFDADGNAPRLVDDFLVAAGTSGSRTYSTVEGQLFAAACPESATPGTLPNPHGVTVSGQTVTWTAYNTGPLWNAGRNTESRILVFTK